MSVSINPSLMLRFAVRIALLLLVIAGPISFVTRPAEGNVVQTIESAARKGSAGVGFVLLVSLRRNG